MMKDNIIKPEKAKVPKHIAVICDGNGRWAQKRGLPRTFGHRAGTEPIKDITKTCIRLGIEVLTIYVFSTENWKRSKEEVDFLMNLFIDFFRKLGKDASNNIKVRHIGIVDNLSNELLYEIKKIEELTKNNCGMILNIALNYGGRSEITNAIQSLLTSVESGELNIEDVNEDIFDNYLFTAGSPDVDLIIRTSGEYRLSNFLIWQSAKAKIWITPTLWPDFKEEHLLEAIDYYNR